MLKEIAIRRDRVDTPGKILIPERICQSLDSEENFLRTDERSGHSFQDQPLQPVEGGRTLY